MSEVIPEKGVCRIVFENTDNNDDYCLDVDADAESELGQSETSNCAEDKIQLNYKNSDTHYYCKEFNKRKDRAVKRTDFSSESEFEDPKKRKLSNTKECDKTEQRPFQNVPDLSYLLENDYNTIRKNFLHQHQNDNLENIPKDQNDSQSHMEITDAVRRLTEILVLPINHSEIEENYVAHQKEFEIFEMENIFDPISMQERSLIDNRDFLKSPCPSSFVCFDKHINNEKNSLRTFRHEKHNNATELDGNSQPDATFETNNTSVNESSHQEVALQKKIKVVEFEYGSDDSMDFNMAVEALNLLKNKGRIHTNSLDENKQTLPNIDGASTSEFKVPQESSLPDSTVKTNLINKPFLECSKIEKKYNLLFDSTLEIRDCATGAIIPFECIYKSNYDAFLTTDENEFNISNESQNEIQTNKSIIPSTLTQLSDTVTCMKVPLDKSSHVLCVCDQESSVVKEIDYRYSEQHQIEVNQTNDTVVAETSLKIAEQCSSLLPKTTIPKEHVYKTKSLTKKSSQNTRKNKKHKTDIQQETKSSKSSKISGKKSKNYKNHFKASSKLSKKTSFETKIKKYDEQVEEMKKNIEKRKSSQSLKTSDCSLKDSFELSSSITNVSSINEGCVVLENESKSPNRYEKCAKESNCNLTPQAFLSSSLKLEEALNQCPGKQDDEHPEKLQNISISTKPQLSEENELTTEKIQEVSYFEKLKTPLDAFNLFINDSMIKRIVQYTNETILGAAKKSKNLGYKKATNEKELRAFIGLLLVSAALKQNHVKVSELWSDCFGASIYRVTLLEGRFYIFLQKLSFCDGTSTDKSDKKNVFQIGDPWEEYLENCKKYPMPRVSVKAQNYTKYEDSKQHYTSVRKTTNLSLSVLFSMLDTAVIRGSAIFLNENPDSGMCMRTFFKQVGMDLVRPQLEEKLLWPTIGSTMRELIQCILIKTCRNSNNVLHPVVDDQTLKKQKRCQLCLWSRDRKTRHQCIRCQRNMCKEHRAKLCIQCIDSI